MFYLWLYVLTYFFIDNIYVLVISSRLFEDGDYQASFLVAYAGIEGFVHRAGDEWLGERLGGLGGAEVLRRLDAVHKEVLSGVGVVGEGEARLALDVLGALLGRGGGEERVVSINVVDVGLFLCLAGLVASFFFDGLSLPLWFDALRIPVIALIAVALFDRFLA